MGKSIISTIFLWFLTSTVHSANQLIDYSSNCTDWSFDSNDKKRTASIFCNSSGSTVASLQLSCAQSKIVISYFGEQHFNNPTGQTQLDIRYILKDAKYTKSAIFKNASADWIVNIPNNEFDHPMFESFSSNEYLDIELENSQTTERFSLNNSRKAITDLINACQNS